MQMMFAVKMWVGQILCRLLPDRTALIYRNFTLPYWHPNLKMGFVERLIRNALAAQLKDNGPEALEGAHRNFWKHQSADGWFRAAASRTSNVYVPAFAPLVDEVSLRASGIQKIVELGCGCGDWLNFLSTRFPSASQFIGVDISFSQIAASQKRHPQLQFCCDDILAWLQKNVSNNTLYHSNSGVLEYLAESSVVTLLDLIKKEARDSLVFLIEPVANDFDFSRDFVSRIAGHEFSYSHNYIKMLRDLDYQIVLQREAEVEGYRTIIVLAAT